MPTWGISMLYDNFDGGGQRVIEAPSLNVGLSEERPRIVGGATKRVFDIVFVLAAIIPASVLMLCIAIALKLSSRGPIIFFHQRVGAGGKTFSCMKFRTMTIDAEARLDEVLARDPGAAAEFWETRKLRKDPRIIPRIGTYLRKTSLDELPQFFNVLLGHMSVVGPRPVTHEEFEQHYGEGHIYVTARPGVTGLWQTSGRNDVSFSDRVEMDATYIRTWSLFRDFGLILRTVAIVCLYQNGH